MGYIQVICYSSALKTVDITGFFKKFCIATRTNASDSSEFEEFFYLQRNVWIRKFRH